MILNGAAGKSCNPLPCQCRCSVIKAEQEAMEMVAGAGRCPYPQERLSLGQVGKETLLTWATQAFSGPNRTGARAHVKTCHSLSLQGKGSFPSALPPFLNISDDGRDRSALVSQPQSLWAEMSTGGRRVLLAPPPAARPEGETGHEGFLDTDTETHKPLPVRARRARACD